MLKIKKNLYSSQRVLMSLKEKSKNLLDYFIIRTIQLLHTPMTYKLDELNLKKSIFVKKFIPNRLWQSL